LLRPILVAASLAGSTIFAVVSAQAQSVQRNWSGTYIGINGGIGWNNQSTNVSGSSQAGSALVNIIFDTIASSKTSQNQKQDANGLLGGAQLGHNWQFGALVLGVETDLQYASVGGDASTLGIFPGLADGFRYTGDQDLKWFGTMRARVGWAYDKVLLFGTGGLAYGRTDANAHITDTLAIGNTGFGGSPPITCVASAVCLAGSNSQTAMGWTAGFGFEFALSQAVTLKTEYLRVDLGDQNVKLTTLSPSSGGGFVTTKFDNAFDLVRAGLNVRY
jgi:outer membrane immunogenic protein